MRSGHSVPGMVKRGWLTPVRRGSARRAGLLIAAALLAVSGGVVAWMVWQSKPRAGAVGLDETAPPPPDITQLPAQPGMGRLGGGSDFYMQVADKKDPSRVAGEIAAAKSTPLEGGFYKLDQPIAWGFLKNGRTYLIEAREGRAFLPQEPGGRPEEGTLRGDVVIRLFDPKPGGGRPDLALDEPVVTARTQSLKFDATLGEITTDDWLEIVSKRVQFKGRGVKLLFSEVQERIELLTVEEREYAIYFPDRKRAGAGGAEPVTEPAQAAAPGAAGAGAAARPAPSGAGATGSTTAAAPAPVVETLYVATLNDDVRIVQAGRSIAGDQLKLWLRLLDNSIPERTLGEGGRRAGAHGSGAGAAARVMDADVTAPVIRAAAFQVGGGADDAPQAPAVDPEAIRAALDRDKQKQLEADPASQPVHIEWSGRLEVRPLAEVSEELRHDDVFARITAAEAGGVRIVDEYSGAQGRGTLAEYAATREAVTLAADTEMGAVARLPGQGYAMAQRFEVSMPTGLVTVPSAGRLQRGEGEPGADAGDESARDPGSLAWSDSGSFEFVVRNGQMTQELKEASASGDVVARQLGSTLRSQTMLAKFGGVPEVEAGADSADSGAAGAERDPEISQLFAGGGVRAEDGKGAGLKADVLRVDFAEPGTEESQDPTPRLIVAEGSVEAFRPDAVLRGGYLEADLTRDEAGELVATRVRAREDVEYEGTDGVTASAATLEAQPALEVVNLTGPDVVVAKDNSSVSGRDVRLDGAAGRMQVVGAGAFETVSGEEGDAQRTIAVWKREMVYNDQTGLIECIGDVEAEMTTGNTGRDLVTSERLTILLSPAEEPSGVPEGERRVLRVEAEGARAQRAEGEPARIEIRRYEVAEAGPERAAAPTLERLMYLEGATIIGDNTKGTVDVPGAGKLLVVDRREAERDADRPMNAGGFDASESDLRGNALFTWVGSFRLNRGDGLAVMNRTVRMAHDRQTDGQRTEIEAEELAATVVEAADQPATDLQTPFEGQLRSVNAAGAVWMRSGRRELVADSAFYDAKLTTVDARAAEQNVVTLFDPSFASPFSARRLLWNLTTDRIEAAAPLPVVAPR